MGDFILRVFKYKMVDLFFKLLKKFWGFIDHTILILQGSNIGGRILSVIKILNSCVRASTSYEFLS